MGFSLSLSLIVKIRAVSGSGNGILGRVRLAEIGSGAPRAIFVAGVPGV
jgi:hypothetical protein